MRQHAAGRHSLADTFTSPASLRTTQVVQTGQDSFHAANLLVRLPLAFFSVCSLVFISMRFNGHDSWLASDGLLLSLFLFAVGVASSYFYLWSMPTAEGILPGLGRRLITVVPTILSVAIFANLLRVPKLEEFALVCLGCGVAQLLIDWRRFVSPSRQRLVHWLPTVTCGAIAGIVVSVVDEKGYCGVLATAATVSIVVTLQLTAPFDMIRTPSQSRLSESPDRSLENANDDSFVVSSLVNVAELQGVAS